MLSGLGWGTNRFAPADLKDQAGLERAAELLIDGVKQGINYIDCGYTYSMGKAEEIVSIALKELQRGGYPCYTSTKVMYKQDPTASMARQRLERSLRKMGVERVTFGFAWEICSYDEFAQMTQHGKLYESLAQAKNEGLIEHICFSSHATVKDTIRIIESGYFEGCTISCNILNVDFYEELFETAKKCGVGIFTMNSLGGGVIPKLNLGGGGIQELNSAAGESQKSLAKMALEELYAHEKITTCLSSMKDMKELHENLSAFQTESAPLITCGIERSSLEPFCTKCRYCAGCPVGLPISDIMYAYNNLIFSDLTEGYGKYNTSAPEQLFNPRFFNYTAIPESEENPCLHCGRCEQKCTQGLPVMERIDWFYQKASEGCYTKRQRRERLMKKIKKNGYKSVCFFPAGNYTQYVIEDCFRFFGDFLDEIYIVDNNERLWGQKIVVANRNIPILAPRELSTLRPELILISNFFFGEEIYQQLLSSEPITEETTILKLHEPGDIPWY